MTNTVRQNCMDFLVTAFTNMTAGQPLNDPYSVTFTKVEREPFDYTGQKKEYALSVEDMTEKKIPKIQVMYCLLRVCIEFYAYLPTNTVRRDEGNRIMGDIQRKAQEDISLGGNAYNIVELSNELNVDGPNVHEIRGIIWYEVEYRHAINDPRKVV